MQTDNPVLDEQQEDDTRLALVISNNPNDFKVGTIDLINRSAMTGQLAYMDAKNEETGEIEAILVGLEPGEEEGTMHIFPIAKLFNKLSEIPEYAAPDGRGNYSKLDPTEPVDFRAEYVAGEEETAGKTEGLNKKQVH